MDDICAFDFDARFCCREAVVRSGAVRLVLGALFAGTGDGLRRKRSHRDPPPPVRDELARKAANCLGVLCAHRETAASASAGRMLDRDPAGAGASSSAASASASTSTFTNSIGSNLRVDTSDAAAQSPGALCEWLYARENGAAIVDALLDLLHAPNHFAQADSLFALSWFLHIDVAERAALCRGVIPRIAALLAAQSAALRANTNVSDALESVRVFGLVCLARLVRMERNTSAALSPTAANAAAAQVRAAREAEEARAALLEAEAKAQADAAAKKAGRFGSVGAKRASVAAPTVASSAQSTIAASASSLPPATLSASSSSSASAPPSSSSSSAPAPVESADQRRHRMQHALLDHLPALVPALLCVVAHLRSHQPLLLALDILAAVCACEPCAPSAAAVAECAILSSASLDSSASSTTLASSSPLTTPQAIALAEASIPTTAAVSESSTSVALPSSSCPVLVAFRPALFRLLFEHRAIFVVAAHKSHALPAVGALARYLLESLLSDEARQYSRVKVCA